jgi:hypothetical protein
MKLRCNLSKNSFRFFAVLLVYSSALYFFSLITVDPDLWGHLVFGREIWTSKAIPRVDIYSYTAYGMPWINHEWLSEAVMWVIFDLFGSPGLLAMKMIIGLVAVSAISLVSYHRRSNFFIYSLVFVLSVFIMSPGFMTRPQLATFLFTPLFFLVIHLYLERKINILWTLPVFMILWANSHGGFLIGAGIVPIIIALEYNECHKKKMDHRHLRSLVLWGIITEASLLINPYGIHLLTFLYRTITLERSITEWAPVSLFDLSYIRLKIFSLFVVAAFFINRDKNRFWEIGIIIVAMLYAFLHQRHTPILAILAAPFLAEKLSGFCSRTGFDEMIGLSYFKISLTVALALITAYQLSDTLNRYIKARFNIIVDPGVYPTGALNFIKANNIKGNLLVPFDWGEDAVWNLYPENKVSIDGRFDTVYPEDVINDHFNGMRSEDGWNHLLKKYPTDIVLAKRDPFSERMINISSDGWVYVYSDDISIIFLKDEAPMREVIERFRHEGFVYPNGGLSPFFP